MEQKKNVGSDRRERELGSDFFFRRSLSTTTKPPPDRKTKTSFFLRHHLFLSRFPTPRATQRVFVVPSGAVPAFVGELESLAFLSLEGNDFQILAPLDILIKGCPRLCQVTLDRPKTLESWAHLEAFKAKLLAKNPDAKVLY